MAERQYRVTFKDGSHEIHYSTNSPYENSDGAYLFNGPAGRTTIPKGNVKSIAPVRDSQEEAGGKELKEQIARLELAVAGLAVRTSGLASPLPANLLEAIGSILEEVNSKGR